MTAKASDSGLLAVDKPVGPSSHDIVRSARRALANRRVGHTGTLDPFASGLLLLGVGRGTRLIEYLDGLAKTYEATTRVGIETDTLDPEGTVVSESEGWRTLDPDRVVAALETMTGEVDQLPPSFSAKKVDGERAYLKARRGEAVDLMPSRVTIHAMEILDVDLPEIRFRVRCSTGTYIRAIARDLGRTLGVGAHLVQLRRTAIGDFSVDRAVTPDEMVIPERVRAAWISATEAVAHLPRIEVGAAIATRFVHGQSPDSHEFPGWEDVDEGIPVAVHRDDALVCVARREGTRMRPQKVFSTLEDLSP